MHIGGGNGREFRSNAIRRSPAIAPQTAARASVMMSGIVGHPPRGFSFMRRRNDPNAHEKKGAGATQPHARP